jgi:hypothetical protein
MAWRIHEFVAPHDAVHEPRFPANNQKGENKADRVDHDLHMKLPSKSHCYLKRITWVRK